MPAWLNISLKLPRRDPRSILYQLATGEVVGSAKAGKARGGYLRKRRALAGITALIEQVVGGIRTGGLWVSVTDDSGVRPTGNIACVQANAAGDTLTFTYGILTIVLTEGGAGAEGYARGASNTTMAAALAATINAHPVLGTILLATPSAGNCALAGKLPGTVLHSLAITTNDATAFTLTQLSGGTPGTAALFPQAVRANKPA